MKPINEVYPEHAKDEAEGDYFYGPGSYQPLLESFGYDIVLQVDDDDYQGDSRLIFKDDSRYGLLIFGWGSCSGCDSLQACDSMKEIEQLRADIHNNIIWKDSAAELLEFTEKRDW